MTELCDIATRHGTDKAPFGWGYTTSYSRWLADRRGEIKTVLEVGVFRGASLRTWRDFFPDAMVYGIDNDATCTVTGEDRIKTFCVDGYLEETYAGPMMQEIGELDLFVDDALHYGEPQLKLFSWVWPHMRHGGVYAIEEVRDDSRDSVVSGIANHTGIARTELIAAGSGYSLLLIEKIRQ